MKIKMRKPSKFAAVILLASGMVFPAPLCRSEGKEGKTIEKEIAKNSGLERMKENGKEAQQKIKKDVQKVHPSGETTNQIFLIFCMN